MTPGQGPHHTEPNSTVHHRLLIVWFAAVAFLCWLPLLPRERILNTQADDLANHVRHVHEYALALREGQFPPLVAPALEQGRRVPVFQYYSNTAYLIPGSLAALRVPPYTALKIVIFLHLLTAGWFVYLACRLLGLGTAAAVVAATAYQAFPFAGCDLISRGSYSEFSALEWVPVVFYCGLRLMRAPRWGARRRWLCLTALSIGFFIPLHPVQTLLCGAVLFLLLSAYAVGDLRTRWSGPLRLLVALALGVLATAWYWMPIARDRAELRVSPHAGFFDAGLASFKVLLWPVYFRPDPWPWGPQLGLHFAIAAVAVLAMTFPWRKSPRHGQRALGVAAALSLVTVLVLIHLNEDVPAWLYHLLKPIQWTYRLLIPAALAGTLCLAIVFERVYARARLPWVRTTMLVAILGYVVGISPPYFYGQAARYLTTPQQVVSNEYIAPNSSAYALRGTDYSQLSLVRPDGFLDTGARVPIPFEGYPTEVEMVVRPEAGAGDVALVLGDANETMDARNPDLPRLRALRRAPDPLTWSDPSDRHLEKSILPGGAIRLAFSIVPPVGLVPGDTALRLESRPAGLKWKVEDLTFRRVGETPDRACRVPSKIERTRGGRNSQFSVEVAPGKDGLYQLPVYYLPSNEVLINGRRLHGHPSGNRALVVVPLRAGPNVIKIRTRPTIRAWWVAALACIALTAGALLPGHKPPSRLPASWRRVQT